MPHLTGRCPCGKAIHFPKFARAGYRLWCRRCGEECILVPHGTPGALPCHRVGSLPPPPQQPQRIVITPIPIPVPVPVPTPAPPPKALPAVVMPAAAPPQTFGCSLLILAVGLAAPIVWLLA